MQLTVDVVGVGLHPSERVLRIETESGDEYTHVHERSLEGSQLEIGYPVGGRGGFWLVELPTETNTGAWRVWVPKQHVIPTPPKT